MHLFGTFICGYCEYSLDIEITSDVIYRTVIPSITQIHFKLSYNILIVKSKKLVKFILFTKVKSIIRVNETIQPHGYILILYCPNEDESIFLIIK